VRHLQRRARLAYALCLAALPAGVLAHLALTDISHGEPDVRLEWGIVRVAALVVAAAVLASLRALHGLLQATRGAGPDGGEGEPARLR
jgi:hypothetical protein